jgi:hypothetical protein
MAEQNLGFSNPLPLSPAAQEKPHLPHDQLSGEVQLGRRYDGAGRRNFGEASTLAARS